MKKYLDSINLTFKFGTMIDEMMKIYLRRISLIYFEDNEKYIIVFYLMNSNLNFEIKKDKTTIEILFKNTPIPELIVDFEDFEIDKII